MNLIEIEKNFFKDKKIVIYFPYPSFGDYLMWSNIPELLNKKYNLDVYISENCKFHNNDVYDFLFKSNPFVKGKTNEPANLNIFSNPTDNIFYPLWYLKSLNLKTDFVIPKVYYKPKKINFNKDCLLFNFSSRTYNFFITNEKIKNELIELSDNLSDKHNLKKLYLKFKNDDSTVSKNFPDEPYEPYVVNDLFDYADLLNSVKYYVGFNSGSSLLPGSIKEYYNPELQVHFFTIPDAGKHWSYPNVHKEFFKDDLKQMETDIELKRRCVDI